MFFKKSDPELNGAWEEPHVFGTRIEIEGNTVAVLWRNSPVLETSFKLKDEDGGKLLVLRKNGLRYAGSATDYAEVERLFYKDGALEFDEQFPITGKSSSTLKKTENTRYGNYDIVDGELPSLAGEWEADEYRKMTIKGNVLTINGTSHRIRLLKSRGGAAPLRIVDEDASVFEWEGLTDFTFDGDTISASMMICDASPMRFVFKRK